MSGRFGSMGKDLQDIVFCIVGLGLIGGSYAKALRRLGVKKIIGVDFDEKILEQSVEEGIIDISFCTPNSALAEADVIICAVYPGAVLKFVEQNVAYFNPRVLLTDAAGIKGDLPEKVDALLGEKMDFVSGHPMAGREGSGLGRSAAEIFDGANYIVVPRPVNNRENIEWLKAFAVALGCSKVTEVSLKQHDKIIAYTSNLPHLLAVALMNSGSMHEDTKYFVAGSFRDATRVADINEELWTDLFLYNADNVLEEIEKMQTELSRWSRALAKKDGDTLKAMMREAAIKRKALNNAENHS